MAAENAGNRSLFLADYNVYLNISWDALRNTSLPGNDLIFGKDYIANGAIRMRRWR